MSILDSIKGEKVMSFGHWRYRLLHWCFNVKNPDPNNLYETGLPKFLYTHYCPLFHLTNLIAIMSPVILGFKVFVAVVVAFFKAMGCIPWKKGVDVLEKIVLLIASKFPERRKVESHIIDSASASPRTKGEERQFIITSLYDLRWEKSAYIPDFDTYWYGHCHMFEALEKDEAKAVYEEWVSRIEAARLRSKERKDRFRQRLIFWTNFSQVFIKWAMNVFYFALALFVAYCVYCLAVPVSTAVYSLFVWVAGGLWWGLTESNFWGGLWRVMKVAVAVALVAGTSALCIYGLFKIGFVQRFAVFLRKGLETAFMPVGLTLQLFGLLWKWVCGGFHSAAEFVSMFYEENCPPIVLKSDDEARLAAIEHDESH